MDVVATIFSTVTGLAGLVIATLVWTSDRRKDEERQARLVSAWAVREGGSRRPATAEGLRGVVVCNSSDAPLSQVGVRVDEPGATTPDGGQMFAQVPPGTYYLQRNDSAEQPWSAPFAVDDTAGGLTVTLDGEEIPLVPVSEVPAELRLAFLGFTDTSGRPWWRIGDGELVKKQPEGWNGDLLRRTTKRDLPVPQRRGRSTTTAATAKLLREVVNLVVEPSLRVDPDAPPTRANVSTSGSAHPLAARVDAIGLAGGTGMSLRLMTDADQRNTSVYYLEANRDGRLPVKFFFGDLDPDVRRAELRDDIIALGHTQAAQWSATQLADALTQVVTRHQASTTTPAT